MGSKIPYLWELSGLLNSGKRVEGGTGVRVNEGARESSFYPFPNLTIPLLFNFPHEHQLSRKALDDLFCILRFTYKWQLTEKEETEEGVKGPRGVHCLNPDVVPPSGEHFFIRMRAYLLLLEVVEDSVPSIKGTEKDT